MKRWQMIIDVEKCEDCNNCFLACKDEHVDNEWPNYSLPQPRHGQRWIDIIRKERGQYPLIDVAYLPKLCMHCEDAPCVEASKGAIYKREDGIVIIDPNKAKGQKELVRSCPYEMIWWNAEKEIPQKCTFCAHLIDEGWKKPRCVQACPTGALTVVYLDDVEMGRRVKTEKLEIMYPEYGTRPRVYYKNMYRYTKCFIAGSISVENNRVLDCAEGVKVTLFRGQDKIADGMTDNFGDFRFDNLAEDSGQYGIEIVLKGYLKVVLEVELQKSVNIGVIQLVTVT